MSYSVDFRSSNHLSDFFYAVKSNRRESICSFCKESLILLSAAALLGFGVAWQVAPQKLSKAFRLKLSKAMWVPKVFLAVAPLLLVRSAWSIIYKPALSKLLDLVIYPKSDSSIRNLSTDKGNYSFQANMDNMIACYSDYQKARAKCHTIEVKLPGINATVSAIDITPRNPGIKGTILLIPGNNGTALDQLRFAMVELAGKYNYRVIVYDPPAYGWTAGFKKRTPLHDEIVVSAVMDWVVNSLRIEKVWIHSTSIGTGSAIEAMRRYPGHIEGVEFHVPFLDLGRVVARAALGGVSRLFYYPMRLITHSATSERFNYRNKAKLKYLQENKLLPRNIVVLEGNEDVLMTKRRWGLTTEAQDLVHTIMGREVDLSDKGCSGAGGSGQVLNNKRLDLGDGQGGVIFQNYAEAGHNDIPAHVRRDIRPRK